MRGRLGLFLVGLALLLAAVGLRSVVGGGSNLTLIIGGLGVLCMLFVRFVKD